MLTDRHQIETASDFQTFEFVSIGPKGRITKEVRYREIDVEDFYNLALAKKTQLPATLVTQP